jgi:ferredoxin
VAHHTLKSGYSGLVDRLNRCPQGAPPTDLLYRILELLFSQREAELVAQLPIKPFTADRAARIWKMPVDRARLILDELADRGVLVDIETRGRVRYVLPPPMAGFFEFSMMRVRSDLDQKVLAELFYEYLNVEEDFVRELFAEGETKLGRAFVAESSLPRDDALHVLDYERASQVAETATDIGVGICYCRHKMEHVGKSCDAPMEICLTFNASGSSLVRHGIARRIDVAECLDLLQQARDLGLVQFGENVREKVNFICNCCGCCCEALLAARRFSVFHPIHSTNFLPAVRSHACTGCGKCVAACPVEALSLVSANDPAKPKRKRSKLDDSVCLGCGVCVPACPEGNIVLEQRGERVITPLNTVHRTVMMAIERGKLEHFLFDNRALASHRALAAIFGVILRLPPIQQAMASRQLKSRYLEKLLN